MKAIVMIFLVAAIVIIALIFTMNVNEVKTINIAALRADRLLIGQSSAEPVTKDPSMFVFLGREYEVVMIGKDRYDEKIVFWGESSDGRRYSATETLQMGFLQEIKRLDIGDDGTIDVIIGKDIEFAVFTSIITVVILGLLGAVLFR